MNGAVLFRIRTVTWENMVGSCRGYIKAFSVQGRLVKQAGAVRRESAVKCEPHPSRLSAVPPSPLKVEGSRGRAGSMQPCINGIAHRFTLPGPRRCSGASDRQRKHPAQRACSLGIYLYTNRKSHGAAVFWMFYDGITVSPKKRLRGIEFYSRTQTTGRIHKLSASTGRHCR